MSEETKLEPIFKSPIDLSRYEDVYLKEYGWDYVFDGEYTTSDKEQSLLCRTIFTNIIPLISNFDSEVYPRDEISILIKNDSGLSKTFLFDVMHNPKKRKQPYAQANYLSIDIDEVNFIDIYHTIGNFAPIPRTVVTRYFGPRLQGIHLNLNELWPWFLKFLKDNWEDFPTKVSELISFNEYMNLSCQHLYFESVFTGFYDEYKETDLSNIDWLSLINSWNEEIDGERFDNKLISFNTLLDFADKTNDEKATDVLEVYKQIRFLIEARGRCIYYLAQKAQERKTL